jgi:hypothetical protein
MVQLGWAKMRKAGAIVDGRVWKLNPLSGWSCSVLPQLLLRVVVSREDVLL